MKRAALLLALVACQRHEPTRGVWPSMPRDDAAARALIAARTRRSIARTHDGGIAGEPIAAGWPAIDEAVRARIGDDGDAWLLVGAHHDRATPVDAFRRLVGPESRVAWTRIAIEQLHVDGGWQGMPLAAQRGESADVTRLGAGDRDAYTRLLASQERDDYAAWKFGYVRSVLDVAAMPRVSACDAPPAVAARFPEASRARLRELHCFVALDGELPAAPRRVAMLWGDDHVAPDGFARFLPADARVVVVHVPREAPAIVVDPVLYGGEELTLLVPEPGSERFVDRVRVHEAPAQKQRVTASGPVRIDGRTADGPFSPGAHVVVTPRVIGAFVMPEDGAVDVRVHDEEPFLSITVAAP